MYAKCNRDEAQGARGAGDKSIHPWAWWREDGAKEGLPGELKLGVISFIKGWRAPNEGPPDLVSRLNFLF